MIGDCSSCSTILGIILAQKLSKEAKDKVPLENIKENWSIEFILDLINQNLFSLEVSGHILGPPEKEIKSIASKPINNNSH